VAHRVPRAGSLEDAIAGALLADRPFVPADAVLVGVGWSTVESERAARELGLDALDAPPDVALGASCRLADGPDGLVLVLLEPVTEGRLARSLARLGEGPVVTWWDVPALDEAATTRLSDGPLGPAHLLRAPDDGRFRFLRSPRAATIPA